MHGPMGGPGRMMAQETSKPKNASSTLRRLGGQFKTYWPILLLVLGLMVGSTYVQVLAPQLLGQSVDCYLTPGAVSQFGVAVSAQAQQASASNCWFAAPLPANATAAQYVQGLGRDGHAELRHCARRQVAVHALADKLWREHLHVGCADHEPQHQQQDRPVCFELPAQAPQRAARILGFARFLGHHPPRTTHRTMHN